MKKTAFRLGKRLLALSLVVVLVALVACGPTAPPASPTPSKPAVVASPSPTGKPVKPVIVKPLPTVPPKIISILTPAEGVTMYATSVSAMIAFEGINMSSASATNKPGEGHINFYLDTPPSTEADKPSTLTDKTKFGRATGTDPFYSFRNVVNGPHTIYMQLVNNNDTPLVPPVTAKVSFTVAADPPYRPPSPSPSPSPK